jgi:hypothetical protein
MRVYLPATLPMLAGWLAASAAEPAGPAYAVTPTLREWYREGGADELEAVAQAAAGGGSIELLAHDQAAPRRRVVLAADVPDADARPAPDVHRAAVRLAGPVPKAGWACALADDPAAVVTVSTAVANLARAALGDDDAQFALEDAGALELAWYAVQELPHLVAEAPG